MIAMLIRQGGGLFAPPFFYEAGEEKRRGYRESVGLYIYYFRRVILDKEHKLHAIGLVTMMRNSNVKKSPLHQALAELVKIVARAAVEDYLDEIDIDEAWKDNGRYRRRRGRLEKSKKSRPCF